MTYEEAEKIMREWSRKMVAKWDKTGLLDGIRDDIRTSSMAVLLESQPKQILHTELTEEEKKWHDALDIIMNRKKQYGKSKKTP